MSFICIAKEGNTYKYINTDSLQCFFSVDKLDSSFFEKSYLKLVKDSRKLGIRNKKIYTVVAEILANSYDEVIGYLVSDNHQSVSTSRMFRQTCFLQQPSYQTKENPQSPDDLPL